MFSLGSIVLITEGDHKGDVGVIWKKPNVENKNHYTVITEDKPYGFWAEEKELAMKFEESADKERMDKEIRDKIYSVKLLNEEYDHYLPEYMDPEVFFMEMAEIYPAYNKKNNIKNGFRVWIYPNDGPIPHVHVVFHGGEESYVKLFSAEYLDGHSKKNHDMNSSEKKDLVKFFNTVRVMADDTEETCWQSAVKLWIQYISGDSTREKAFRDLAKKDSKGHYIMPDYSQLEKSKSLTYEDLFNSQ